MRPARTPVAALSRPGHGLNNLERFLANARRLATAFPTCSRAAPAPWRSSCNCSAPASLQRSARRQPRLPRHAPRAAAPQPRARRDARRSFRPRSTPPTRTPPSCAPSAASASGRCCASAPTTSSATARSKRSPATSRASPTPPSKSPCATALQNVGHALRRAHAPARRAGPLRRPRVRQARRRGAELLQRHRPDVRLRRGGRDAPAARRRRRQRRVLRPRRRRGGPPAVGPHRPRPGVPRRPAAAARRAARPAGPLAGQHARLLRHAGPHLGAAGADQGAARRRRRRARRASSSRPSSRSSTASTSASPRSTRSRR